MICGRTKKETISRACRTLSIALLAAVASAVTVGAATPPDRIQYQGVLRDSADAPLDGDFDMDFRFWSAETAGEEILLDRHLAANLQAVTVAGGLFSVAIGTGELLDGSGPGTYAALSEVFRDYGDLWLEVQVGSETLSPRIAVAAAGYALNAAHLEGRPAGHFLDTSSTAQTKSGNLIVDASGLAEYGIEAVGNQGGAYFRDGDGGGYAYVGVDNVGIQAYGAPLAGYFEDLNLGAYAYVGNGTKGVEAYGTFFGGFFKDMDASGLAYVGNDDYGIRASGNAAGGYFYSLDAETGYAWVGTGNYGIRAFGVASGGYFKDADSNGYAYVGVDNHGIHAYGDTAGGYFKDNDHGTQTRTAYGTASTWGTGAKNFVQNHPDDPSRKIVYTALEGNEVGTYTRGSARLKDGIARVELDETFAWVTNPDVGLTAHVTARSPGGVVYVESVSTDDLVVRAVDGFDDEAAFDYLVSGLRIGFEEIPTVQPKDAGESLPIPSMAGHRALLEKRPELAAFTPLERFRTMEARAFPAKHGAGLDLSRARALVAAIHEFDPASDTAPAPELQERALDHPEHAALEVSPIAEPGGETVTSVATTSTEELLVPVTPQLSGHPASDDRPPAGAILLPVSGAVEAGDLLALDPERPGALQVATTMADPGVVGVAMLASSPGAGGSDEVAVIGSGFATLKADAGYGAIRAGDLLTSSATPGHAMRALAAEPGTIVGKALEPLEVGRGTIRVLLMAR